MTIFQLIINGKLHEMQILMSTKGQGGQNVSLF